MTTSTDCQLCTGPLATHSDCPDGVLFECFVPPGHDPVIIVVCGTCAAEPRHRNRIFVQEPAKTTPPGSPAAG